MSRSSWRTDTGYQQALDSAKQAARRTNKPALVLRSRDGRTFASRGCYNASVAVVSQRAERDGWDVYEVVPVTPSRRAPRATLSTVVALDATRGKYARAVALIATCEGEDLDTANTVQLVADLFGLERGQVHTDVQEARRRGTITLTEEKRS